ncbi:uncharacterized protein LOC128857647 [Anastrepha ludens]|uniref:uncharacterized protein LOC128857647 n=1 Tax=Anastrepha ludens TaxID=28586 RepID=UPI0023B16B29|nr:uncharacterized protein LOC128857647 [Anastrepha ludens]
MAHEKSLEALNRTLKDLRENQRLFGNALILLTGDFRQTLPVIPRSTPADELNACLKASNLWRYVTKLTLNTNVRVQLQNDSKAEVFSKQLLQIGNGRIPIDNNGLFKFPDHFCQIAESKADLVQNYKNHNWLSERAILAGTNKDVNEINADILDKIPGDTVVYRSVDTVIDQDQVVNYPTEFLNSMDISGFPPHYLQLKVDATIIMLRNINHPKLSWEKVSPQAIQNCVIEAGFGKTDMPHNDNGWTAEDELTLSALAQ